jgi:hypothetical protein
MNNKKIKNKVESMGGGRKLCVDFIDSFILICALDKGYFFPYPDGLVLYQFV